ncbi:MULTISPECIES: S-methyl-5'-thioadenosine phosphorylase [Limnochorda]|uniref:S-methyl-5'-thioadenosine phosphorylase n=1 Tax=Limnochorda TaxID=1676651 RepID=UPI00182B81FC|nr:S-methyl-5'-thioadenosine phosphorylase [Limnochorda pilosa]MBO2486748.1 5'-methylthioadenosine phosphorylase [Bacillota bacterium]MBO2519856.1 5'-methylthioadenosine phosphorylase [Bacillota bacterium]NMA71192.1 S-methyl-5'-thioadenosine phosphorylase [Bacillota bacterium]
MRVGLIGGTGLYQIGSGEAQEVRVQTPFGPVRLRQTEWAGQEVFFVPRHGEQHQTPPHRINYRANIWALREVGVERVLSSSAVGSLRREMRPGDLAVVDQFLDFTRGRVSTFYEGGPAGVYHVDVTEPYCPELRATIQAAAAELFGNQEAFTVHPSATYVCAEGPRYETAAEIRAFRQLGGDLVGMTNVPEVVLAREAGLCYATIGIVTNLAAGLADTPLSHQEVVDVMNRASERLQRLLETVIGRLPARGCACASLGGPWPPAVAAP